MSTMLGQAATRWRRFAVLCLAAGPLMAAAAVHGQGGVGTISGRVTDPATQLPILGATVQIEGTRLGAVVGPDGRYRIANVPAGSHTVIAASIGYASARQTVQVGPNAVVTADFTLPVSAVSLAEFVVTGVAGGERVRTIGNSVARVNAVEAVALGAPPTVSTLLNARAPGVVIGFATGRLGASQEINIRGRSSLGLGDSPLIYVDGVRVNTATTTGPSGGGFGGQGAQIAGRINDIDPNDIESIEVIKGPAAATIYGTEASSGVIQIFTKRGAVGTRPAFALQVQQGAIWFRDPSGRIPTNYQRDPVTNEIVTWNGVEQEKARGTPLFRTGHAQTYQGSVSGGVDQVRYYLSGSYQDDNGVEPNNELQQFSLHANVNVTPSAKFDVGASLHFVDLKARLGTDLGASALLGAVGGHILRNANSRGFAFGFPPEVSWELWDNMSDVNRFTASGVLNHRPTNWLSQRLLAGIDYTGDDSRALERFAPPDLAVYLSPTGALGRIQQTLRHSTRLTFDYAATGRADVTSDFSASTSIGLQAFRTNSDQSALGGTAFPGVGVETVSATSIPIAASQSETVNTTVGGYVQEKFGFRDRLFLTGAVRVDNNSAFGEDFKWVTYPKFDVSWVASEEPFWRWSSVVNTLRLRAAYGESGRSPQTFSALRTFTPVQGPGSTNAVTPNTAGNPNLKPERGKEIEAGFEAGFFNRLTVDFTYFNKKTVDVIINQAVAPSTGFPGSVPTNLGRVDNSGVELLATLNALDRENWQWSITGNFATSNDVIKDLGTVPGAITSPGAANRVGYPIGGVWTRRVVSADRDPTTNLPVNVLCDGGPGAAPVACAGAPFVFLGTTTPKRTGAIINTLTIMKRLRLYGMVDFQRGNLQANSNEELRCTGGFGYLVCEENFFPERFSPVRLAETVGTARAMGIIDQYFQDASYFKLRELSATYTIPERWLRGVSGASVTLVGRELATWTDYRGLDPDVSVAVDQARLPQLSRFNAIFNVRF
jgi:TonB-linked SusC/RagA family outer membrane protein